MTNQIVEIRPDQGTVFHPPLFQTCDELISFWSTVAIPDHFLHQLRKVAIASKAKDEGRTHSAFLKKYPKPEPSSADYKEWEARYHKVGQLFHGKFPDVLPHMIRPPGTDVLDARIQCPPARSREGTV